MIRTLLILFVLVALAAPCSAQSESCILLPWPGHPPGAPDDPPWSVKAGTSAPVLYVALRTDDFLETPTLCLGWRGASQPVAYAWAWVPPGARKFTPTTAVDTFAVAYRQWPDRGWEVISVHAKPAARAK